MLNCLLLANVIAEERGKPLGQLVAELAARVRAALLRTTRSAHFGRIMKQSAIERAHAESTQALEPLWCAREKISSKR